MIPREIKECQCIDYATFDAAKISTEMYIHCYNITLPLLNTAPTPPIFEPTVVHLVFLFFYSKTYLQNAHWQICVNLFNQNTTSYLSVILQNLSTANAPVNMKPPGGDWGHN